MRKTIVALYDTPTDADTARQRLLTAGFDETDIDLHSDGGFGGSMDGHGGVVATILGWGVPEAEAHAYAEGLRNGGTLLTASLLTDEAVARATAILEPGGHDRAAVHSFGLGGAAEAMRDVNMAPPPQPHPAPPGTRPPESPSVEDRRSEKILPEASGRIPHNPFDREVR